MQDQRNPCRTSRCIAFVAVLAIHLIFLMVLAQGWRMTGLLARPPEIIAALDFVQDSTARKPPGLRARAHGFRKNKPPEPVESVSPSLVAPIPAVPEGRRDTPPTDWTANLVAAARSLVTAQTLAQQRRGSMGRMPFSNFDAGAGADRQPSFPWSHQPLTRWVDVDPDSHVITFSLGKHCRLALFLVIPGIGCVLGPLDPEPGRGDLFDPKYHPAPLELPVPSLAATQER